MIFMICMLEI